MGVPGGKGGGHVMARPLVPWEGMIKRLDRLYSSTCCSIGARRRLGAIPKLHLGALRSGITAPSLACTPKAKRRGQHPQAPRFSFSGGLREGAYSPLPSGPQTPVTPPLKAAQLGVVNPRLICAA